MILFMEGRRILVTVFWYIALDGRGDVEVVVVAAFVMRNYAVWKKARLWYHGGLGSSSLPVLVILSILLPLSRFICW